MDKQHIISIGTETRTLSECKEDVIIKRKNEVSIEFERGNKYYIGIHNLFYKVYYKGGSVILAPKHIRRFFEIEED